MKNISNFKNFPINESEEKLNPYFSSLEDQKLYKVVADSMQRISKEFGVEMAKSPHPKDGIYPIRFFKKIENSRILFEFEFNSKTKKFSTTGISKKSDGDKVQLGLHGFRKNDESMDKLSLDILKELKRDWYTKRF